VLEFVRRGEHVGRKSMNIHACGKEEHAYTRSEHIVCVRGEYMWCVSVCEYGEGTRR
jgi:hypothetical protein